MEKKSKNEKHGMTKTSEYQVWAGMKARCYNKKNKRYSRYGGRGITVCGRWFNSFLTFLEDMGNKPFPKAQIDRIDNDGNYSPDNCQWTTCKENIRNSAHAKLTIDIANEIRKIYKKGNSTYKELGIIYGTNPMNIRHIINNKTWT